MYIILFLGLLRNLGIKAPLNNIPFLGGILFQMYRMNQILNKFLLAGKKFMPEMHWKQPSFTFSACVTFTKNKERIKKLRKTGNTDFIHKTDLDKACFQYDMAYGKSKDLARRTESDKVLRDKAFEIASDPKYDGYQRGLTSIVHKFFDKKSSGGAIKCKPSY